MIILQQSVGGSLLNDELNRENFPLSVERNFIRKGGILDVA